MIEEILLRDQTTGKNIIWANAEFGDKEIQLDDVKRIEPRWKKLREHQKLRTKVRAEIFTPPEICKLQNDLIAANKKSWQDFIDAKFLEITCGEAPYLVSRYNAVTGEPIEISQRVGLLDRKLRVVNRETSAVADWINFATRAVQSVYGYDFQGDNLFLARRNVFETVKDYYAEKFSREPREDFLFEVAEIISWNLWQMNGRTNAIPYYEPPPKKTTENPKQGTLGFGNEYEPEREPENVYCKIMNWTTGEPFEFITLTEGARL